MTETFWNLMAAGIDQSENMSGTQHLIVLTDDELAEREERAQR
jgi:hypothetical protein